jgi:hypothetical protein
MAASAAATTAPMTRFEPKIFYVPFPIGVSRGVFADDLYAEMLAQYPPKEIFRHTNRSKDVRYTLNDVRQRDRFLDWVQNRSCWREFYRWIRDPAFAQSVFDALARAGVDLGMRSDGPSLYRQLRQAAGDIVKRRRAPRLPRFVHTRFEFAMLPGDGGYFKPHTDATNTLVTLVITMIGPDEWNPAWGGELEICKPKDQNKVFNWVNRVAEFAEVEPLHKFPFVPNQCMFFVKTYDSWHCVRPMTASPEAGALRRTLTIVIERD